VPIYWSGTLVLFVLVATFGGQRELIWPVLVLGFHSAGSIARLLQTEIQQVIHAPFVRTAYSKGLSRLQVTRRHVLPVALVPVIQIIALQAGILFSGTVITETLFSRPGLGLMLWNATLERDYPVVQGVVILIATTYIILNTLSHLLSQMLDPRLRDAS
jgi:ABC-type dipeptide/oligopeptide/nickel transport system permease component